MVWRDLSLAFTPSQPITPVQSADHRARNTKTVLQLNGSPCGAATPNMFFMRTIVQSALLPNQPGQPKRLRRLLKSPPAVVVMIGTAGALVLLAAAPLALAADFLWALQLFRLWSQISAAFAGLLMLAIALVIRPSRWTRTLLLLWAALLIATVIDSSDGRLDVLPAIIFLPIGASLILAIDTGRIIRSHRTRSALYWLGCAVGITAIGLYIGMAIYYTIINLRQGLPDYPHHPMYTLSIFVMLALRYICEALERRPPQQTAAQ